VFEPTKPTVTTNNTFRLESTVKSGFFVVGRDG
jgi:hypothetical protein